ncbi:hypothetical protein DPMN_109758 [Dreissena polymorpha]|uniref:B box-type domain-containing protein n=1 Tax=Dreissena polymorpha TaxID=45954 RepID=A0A9D4KB99_DREPO|nr:hypothetical protein DPMN_109758 [Dreissena polymorpha]
MPKLVQAHLKSCEFHRNNPVQFYCKNHNDVICAECKELKHKICMGVVSLAFFQSTETRKDKFDHVTKKLEKYDS